jgi:hypothetical protein
VATRRTTGRIATEQTTTPVVLDCTNPAGLIACARRAISTLPGAN